MYRGECPHCGKQSIGLKQKFLAGKWIDIYCDECGGRSVGQPIVLAIMYFIYVWNILFFGFVAIWDKSWVYAVVGIIGALLLEFFIFYVPLTALRKKSPAS